MSNLEVAHLAQALPRGNGLRGGRIHEETEFEVPPQVLRERLETDPLNGPLNHRVVFGLPAAERDWSLGLRPTLEDPPASPSLR